MFSAFGIDHGDFSKAFNPLKAFKGARRAKPAGPKLDYEDPFSYGSKTKAIPKNGRIQGNQLSRKVDPRAERSRNAGLGASFKGNQGGMSIQTPRKKDLG